MSNVFHAFRGGSDEWYWHPDPSRCNHYDASLDAAIAARRREINRNMFYDSPQTERLRQEIEWLEELKLRREKDRGY